MIYAFVLIVGVLAAVLLCADWSDDHDDLDNFP